MKSIYWFCLHFCLPIIDKEKYDTLVSSVSSATSLSEKDVIEIKKQFTCFDLYTGLQIILDDVLTLDFDMGPLEQIIECHIGFFIKEMTLEHLIDAIHNNNLPQHMEIHSVCNYVNLFMLPIEIFGSLTKYSEKSKYSDDDREIALCRGRMLIKYFPSKLQDVKMFKDLLKNMIISLMSIQKINKSVFTGLLLSMLSRHVLLVTHGVKV